MGFTTGQTLGSVFTMPPYLSSLSNDTLLTALSYPGGSGDVNAARILLRAAVAALLNASQPSIVYPLSVSEVISQVNTALASQDRDTLLDLATQIDDYNNLESQFCGPASRTPTPTRAPTPTRTPRRSPTPTSTQHVTPSATAAGQTQTPSPAPTASPSPTALRVSGLPSTGGLPGSSSLNVLVFGVALLLMVAGGAFVAVSRRSR